MKGLIENTFRTSNALPKPLEDHQFAVIDEDIFCNSVQELSQQQKVQDQFNIIVAGSVALDCDCQYKPPPGKKHQVTPLFHTSNMSEFKKNIGGVGYNVTRAIQLAGSSVKLCSVVGNDTTGRYLLSLLKEMKIEANGVKPITKANSAQYIAFNSAQGDLLIAMADMTIFDNTNDQGLFEEWMIQLRKAKPKWIMLDANWNTVDLYCWFRAARNVNAKIAYEPVSVPKAGRIFEMKSTCSVFPRHDVDMISPNEAELSEMYNVAKAAKYFERQDWRDIVSSYNLPSTIMRSSLPSLTSTKVEATSILQQSLHLLPFFPIICTKLGSKGLLLTMLLQKGDERLEKSHVAAPWILTDRDRHHDQSEGLIGGIYIRHFKPAEVIAPSHIVSVNGIGDTLLGALLAKMDQTGKGVEELVDFAQEAAIRTLKTHSSVSIDISRMT